MRMQFLLMFGRKLGFYIPMKHFLSICAFCFTLLVPIAANALCICLECAWALKRHFIIQSEHMKPALETGDCVVVDLSQASSPEVKHGDIVVFDHPMKRGTTFISRVVGLPGDTVQLKEGVVWLNNVPLPQRELGTIEEKYVRDEISGSFPRCANTAKIDGLCIQNRFEETLPNGTHYSILDLGIQRLDNTGKYVIPDEHLFLLGDHRDNSTDSRISQSAGGFGFIPVSDIIGILNDLR